MRHESGLPWESSIYVPKILAAAIVGHNQAAFGFADVTPDPPFAYDEVEAPAGTALATVARAAGAKRRGHRGAEPAARARAARRPTAGRRACACRRGRRRVYAANLDKARAADKSTPRRSCCASARRWTTSRARAASRVRELRRLNGVKDSAELRAGMAIVVPKRGAAAPRPRRKARTTDGEATATPAGDAARRRADDDIVMVAVPERSFSYEGRERVFYRTRDGDGLDEIADAFGVRSDELRRVEQPRSDGASCTRAWCCRSSCARTSIRRA